MASIKMMRGDSYIVPIELKQNGVPLTSGMVTDVEVCVGDALRKTFSGGGVGFDTVTKRWYIRPTQAETLAMEPGSYHVIARVKYSNTDPADVVGLVVGMIIISDTNSEEVI